MLTWSSIAEYPKRCPRISLRIAKIFRMLFDFVYCNRQCKMLNSHQLRWKLPLSKTGRCKRQNVDRKFFQMLRLSQSPIQIQCERNAVFCLPLAVPLGDTDMLTDQISMKWIDCSRCVFECSRMFTRGQCTAMQYCEIRQLNQINTEFHAKHANWTLLQAKASSILAGGTKNV